MNHTSEYPNSPDIVIVNVKSRSDESSKCLPIHFSGDDACRGSILFYICFDPETSKHTVKYLIPHDTTKFPLLYKGEDGTDPQPGCSGSPIIEARVLVTRDPVWQFRVVGMVYARCPYSLEVETSDTMVIEEKLVCAIPVRFDFEQIRLGILMPKEMAWRDEAVANVFRESKPKIAEKYYALAESSHSQADKNFQEFIEGKTDLDISLPNGLEKLVGNRILKLEDSLLLLKNQKRHRGKEFPVTVEGLSDLKVSSVV